MHRDDKITISIKSRKKGRGSSGDWYLIGQNVEGRMFLFETYKANEDQNDKTKPLGSFDIQSFDGDGNTSETVTLSGQFQAAYVVAQYSNLQVCCTSQTTTEQPLEYELVVSYHGR